MNENLEESMSFIFLSASTGGMKDGLVIKLNRPDLGIFVPYLSGNWRRKSGHTEGPILSRSLHLSQIPVLDNRIQLQYFLI